MSLHVGEAVGDYRVVGIIGAGGMGQVFQVEHKITKRKEAMKVLIADLADDTQIQRFKREIEVQARLNHPNIAAVHNAFRLKDRLILVLEFVEGRTLENILKRGKLPWETGFDYMRQTLDALSYAHENGVIHRDVSPANLMVTDSGLVKLMDFGVAKSLGDFRLTDGGSMIGSLYYMAPEQVKGGSEPDPRADVYSAGAILYEIVTGRRPFDYQDRFSLMVAQVEEQARPPREIEPELPAGLDEIILKALAKDPGARYQSAKELLHALEQVSKPAPVAAPPPIASPRRSRIATIAASAAAVVVCALAGAGALAWNRFEEPAAPVLAATTPSVPQALMAIPAAPPTVVEEPKKTAVVAKAPARKNDPKIAPVHHEARPTEAAEQAAVLSVEAQQPEHRQPEPLRAESQPPVTSEVDVQQPEQKKTRFWSRLNPFHKKASVLKKKPDATALRAPGDSPVDPQK